MIYGVFDVMVPVLIHIIITNLTLLALGNRVDAAFLTTAAAVVTLPVLAFLYHGDRQERPKEKVCIPWWVYPLAAAAGAVMNYFVSGLMSYFAVTEHFSNAVQEGLLESGTAVQLVGLGVLVPIMEELLFRGLVYQRLKKYFPVRVSILLGAAVFALYHGNMVQILFAFPMAIVMLLAYEKWQSLAVPVVFHMAVNLSTVLQNYGLLPNLALAARLWIIWWNSGC